MKSEITIKKIQDLLLEGVQEIYVDDDTSRRMWWASLEVIQKDFLSQNYKQGGIWVASPLPALNDKKIFKQLDGWLWSPEGVPYFQKENAGFLPVNNSDKKKKDFDLVSNFKVLNLSQKDGYEPFLMIITPNFQCILTITGEKDKKILFMKCDEESLKISIELMHAKLNQENYEEGVQEAQITGKPIFVDFTGYTCTNCRWMEVNVFVDKEVEELFENFVLIKLYTDAGPNHKEYRQMEIDRYNTSALPFYVVLDTDENEVKRFHGMDPDISKFIKFLKLSLEEFRG